MYMSILNPTYNDRNFEKYSFNVNRSFYKPSSIPLTSNKYCGISDHQQLFNSLFRFSRVMQICVSKLATIRSDNGLSPVQHQAIIWTDAVILLIGPLGTIHTFLLKKMHLKMLSAKQQSFGLSLIVLTHRGQMTHICVSKQNIIGSDNGLSPGRHQAITWTNAGILLIGP